MIIQTKICKLLLLTSMLHDLGESIDFNNFYSSTVTNFLKGLTSKSMMIAGKGPVTVWYINKLLAALAVAHVLK
jgi:hypothetical protein